MAVALMTFAVALCLGVAAAEQSSSVSLARKLIQSGQVPEAEKILRAAIENGQDTAELHGELGSLLYQAGRFHEAVSELGERCNWISRRRTTR